MKPQPFVAPMSTTIDANGDGSITIAPPGGYVWNVTITSTRVTPYDVTTDDPVTTRTFIDGVYLEGTAAGYQATSDTKYSVAAGSQFTMQWIGAPAGSRATCVLRGTQERE